MIDSYRRSWGTATAVGWATTDLVRAGFVVEKCYRLIVVDFDNDELTGS